MFGAVAVQWTVKYLMSLVTIIIAFVFVAKLEFNRCVRKRRTYDKGMSLLSYYQQLAMIN